MSLALINWFYVVAPQCLFKVEFYFLSLINQAYTYSTIIVYYDYYFMLKLKLANCFVIKKNNALFYKYISYSEL